MCEEIYHIIVVKYILLYSTSLHKIVFITRNIYTRLSSSVVTNMTGQYKCKKNYYSHSLFIVIYNTLYGVDLFGICIIGPGEFMFVSWHVPDLQEIRTYTR